MEKYIERCARSLFEQTLNKGIEFIFINDCTPDRSIEILNEILEQYPNRKSQTRIISHKHNQGLAASRNTGLEYAKGEYIIHCDSDDWVDPNIYIKMLETAIKTQADITVCDFFSVFPKRKTANTLNTYPTIHQFRKGLLEGTYHNGVWNKLIRRSVYDQLDLFWVEGVNMWEDVSIINRLAYQAKSIAYIKEALYFYNLTNSASYTKNFSPQSIAQIDKAYGIVSNFYKSKADHDQYADSLVRFKQRTLMSILRRVPANKRKEWMDRYDYLSLPNPSYMPFFSRFSYNLYIKGHKKFVDFLTRINEYLRNQL
ncbi:MAG: glycosyltransferase family 2 protein [Muribaculaceae bacterium]|nr:glycosyltransferase family 2 protein [Muribaculaceae bacterium]